MKAKLCYRKLGHFNIFKAEFNFSLENECSIRQVQLSKWSFLVHITTRNAPYIHPSHDSIFELWRTFPNAICHLCLLISLLTSVDCQKQTRI